MGTGLVLAEADCDEAEDEVMDLDRAGQVRLLSDLIRDNPLAVICRHFT